MFIKAEVDFNVSCPVCHLYHLLQTYDFVCSKVEYHQCNECNEWFIIDLIKYKNHIVAYNVTACYAG